MKDDPVGERSAVTVLGKPRDGYEKDVTESDIPEADRIEQSLPSRAPDEAEVIDEVDELIGEDAPVNSADAFEQREPR